MASAELPRLLISKRRDIMIESAAYDMIKQEGRQQGREEGREEGKIEEAREGILDVLEARFVVVPASIVKEIRGIDELAVLKALRRSSARVGTLDELRVLLTKVQD
jgi:predicted transposase YdaD